MESRRSVFTSESISESLPMLPQPVPGYGPPCLRRLHAPGRAANPEACAGMWEAGRSGRYPIVQAGCPRLASNANLGQGVTKRDPHVMQKLLAHGADPNTKEKSRARVGPKAPPPCEPFPCLMIGLPGW